jgi:hypothetical protein
MKYRSYTPNIHYNATLKPVTVPSPPGSQLVAPAFPYDLIHGSPVGLERAIRGRRPLTVVHPSTEMLDQLLAGTLAVRSA